MLEIFGMMINRPYLFNSSWKWFGRSTILQTLKKVEATFWTMAEYVADITEREALLSRSVNGDESNHKYVPRRQIPIDRWDYDNPSN